MTDTYSEEWRAECEARYVIKLKKLEDRQHYIEMVRERRGDAMAAKLQADIARLWPKRKK